MTDILSTRHFSVSETSDKDSVLNCQQKYGVSAHTPLASSKQLLHRYYIISQKQYCESLLSFCHCHSIYACVLM